MKTQIQRAIPDPNNEDLRVYFSKEELTHRVAHGNRGEKLPNIPVLKATLEIRGIAFAGITPYALTVIKAPTWKWEEIEPSILRLLSSLNLGQGKLLEETSETDWKDIAGE